MNQYAFNKDKEVTTCFKGGNLIKFLSEIAINQFIHQDTSWRMVNELDTLFKTFLKEISEDHSSSVNALKNELHSIYPTFFSVTRN